MTPDAADDCLRELLRGAELPRDALPYTPEFGALKLEFVARTGLSPTDHAFWKRLSRIAKRGGVSGNRRRRAPAVRRLSEEEKLELLRLFPAGLGDRDDLPYTGRFDDLYAMYTSRVAQRTTKYEFWRATSSIGKNPRRRSPAGGGLSPEVVAFLERQNPWWTGRPGPILPPFRRWAFAEIRERLRSRIAPIIAVRGPRQVGKTTIQQQVIEHLVAAEHVDGRRILRVQFDETPALGSLLNPIESIVRWYEQQILGRTLNEAARDGGGAFLFLDEVQNQAAWSAQLKSLVDSSTVQIVVTGSSALRIAQARDSLAGRLSSIEMGPLRLTEIARIRDEDELAPFSHPSRIEAWTDAAFWHDLNSYAEARRASVDRAFDAYSEYGGYPICHRTPAAAPSSLAAQVLEQVVERTIRHERAAGASEEVVVELFRLLCRHAGERLSPAALREKAAVRLGDGVSLREVRAGIAHLEDTLLVRLLQPLELGRRSVAAAPTICLCDHFLRYAMFREKIPLDPRRLADCNEAVRTQAGHLVEGIVGNFFAGAAGLDAYSCPERADQPEVDVVIRLGAHHLPLEVKYRARLRRDDLIGVESFCSKPHHEAEFGLIVTQSEAGQVAPGAIAVPAKNLLLLL